MVGVQRLRKTRSEPVAGQRRAFTLIELIIVMSIMVLLSALGAPLLSKLMKGSKVRQTVEVVYTACLRARAEAWRNKTTVGVFFGDDRSHTPAMWTLAPLKDVVPPYGRIETWTVKTAGAWNQGFAYTERSNQWNEDGICGSAVVPCDQTGTNHLWDSAYPFWLRDKPLSNAALTFQDGVRIIPGYYSDTGVARKFSWDANTGPVYEIKRHSIVYQRNGGAPLWGGIYSYQYLLVFDSSTGEHVVMRVSEWKSGTRPVVLCDKNGPIVLTHVAPVGGADVKLNALTELPNLVK